MPGAKHSSTADRNSNYWELYLSLGPDFFRHLVELKVINTNIQFWRCGLQYEWINEVWCFKDRLKQADYLDGSQAMLIIYKLINDLRLQGERNSVLGRDGRIIRGMELLRANCCTSRSQKEIAGKVGMSHERFRKVFKEQAGITPGQYRIRCRMDKAKALLNNRALSLSEIAMELGYPDVFSFSRQFRQQAGIPPGRYRLYSDISYIL